MGVRREIVVSVSYFDFKFVSLADASLFANMAAEHIEDKNRNVQLNIQYIQDDEVETDDTESEEE